MYMERPNESSKLEEFLSGSFDRDTRKVLNRSDVVISDEILEEVEAGITLERLRSLDVPVYFYSGQITIHGIFKDVSDKLRIGGYKFVFQNQNKSVGVKYPAIDYAKKVRIMQAIALSKGLTCRFSSTTFKILAMTAVSTPEETIAIANKYRTIVNGIKELDIFGTHSVWLGSLLGTKFVVMDICINALTEESVNPAIKIITGFSPEQVADMIAEKERVEAEKQKERDAESAKNRQLYQEVIDAYKVAFFQNLTPVYTFQKDKCYFRVVDGKFYSQVVVVYKFDGKNIRRYTNLPDVKDGYMFNEFNTQINKRERKSVLSERDKQALISLVREKGMFEIKENCKCPTPRELVPDICNKNYPDGSDD